MKYIKLLLLLIPIVGYGQQPWTYERCVSHMQDNNLAVQQQQIELQNNQLDVSKSKLELLPSISLGTGSNIGLGRSVDPFTNDFTRDPVFSVFGNLDISFTVFDGFRKWNAIKRARLGLEAKEWEIKKRDRDVRIQLAGVYMQLLFNIEKLKNEESQLELNKAQLERVALLVKEGRLPKNDQNNLAADIAQNQLDVLTASDAIFQTKFELKQVLQLPEEEMLDLVWPELKPPDDSILLYTYASLTDIFRELPETKVNTLNMEQAALDYKESKTFFLPKVSLSYGLGSSILSNSTQLKPGSGGFRTIINEIGYVSADGGFTMGNPVYQQDVIPPDDLSSKTPFGIQLRDNFSQTIGIGIDIPFLNSTSYLQQTKKRAKLALQQTKIEAKIQADQVRKDLNQLLMDAKTAYKSYQLTKKRVEIMEESYRITTKKYNSGRVGYLEYMTTSNNLETSMDDLIRAKYNSILKIKILKFYMGETISLD